VAVRAPAAGEALRLREKKREGRGNAAPPLANIILSRGGGRILSEGQGADSPREKKKKKGRGKERGKARLPRKHHPTERPPGIRGRGQGGAAGLAP